ncbi:MAG: tetrahydromethanopterin S-methyltransferase subunit H [Candidatus Bathyarchaeota archaeon]|nr:MAG: tetrahydromethanopterin S-methyltransferase subunit H [Candidatus Bathyarchaeota archaeon]
MFKFEAKQKIFKIGEAKVGGQPGELPTLLIGTTFYEGHKIVKDEKRGIFDKKKAEALLNVQDELSDLTGNPCGVDIVATTVQSALRYVDFVSEFTDSLISFDAWLPEVRIAALTHIAEVGLAERTIYNSIMPTPPPDESEIAAIKESKVKAAILLAYNVKDRTPKGVVSLLKGTQKQKGLLKIAEEAGIEKPLVDTTLFTYIPSIGVGAKACFFVKEKLGLPVGGSPGNAASVWKEARRWGPDILKACWASVEVVPLILGADYLLYGPIESASWVIPASAAIDAIIATSVRIDFGIKPLSKKHPLYKLFPAFVETLEKATF